MKKMIEAMFAAFKAAPVNPITLQKELNELLKMGPDPVVMNRPRVLTAALWLIWARMDSAPAEFSFHQLIPPYGMDGVKLAALESLELQQWKLRYNWDTMAVVTGRVDPFDHQSHYFVYEVLRRCLAQCSEQGLAACRHFADSKMKELQFMQLI